MRVSEGQSLLFCAEQVRELDALAAARAVCPSYALMSRAGQAAYRVLRARWPAARRIAVLCGAGNNAGDGYVIARRALDDGLRAQVFYGVAPTALSGDAARAAAEYQAVGGPTAALADWAADGWDVLVDALLGTGVARPLQGRWLAAVNAMNASGTPVLAVDVPSGLHPDRGAPLPVAVRAAVTVSFVGQKRGLFTADGPEYCGERVFEPLQADAAVWGLRAAQATRLLSLDSIRGALPRRHRNAHKHCFGRVAVIGGDAGMGGAAILASAAALAVGAGVVRCVTRREHLPALLSAYPEIMSVAADQPTVVREVLDWANVVVLGPGLGRRSWGRAVFAAASGGAQPLVLDADGLNLLPLDGPRRADRVLTPHPGEAARLLGIDSAQVQADRFAAVDRLQARFGGVAVLKGAGTLVAAEDEPVQLCPFGHPGMAGGGMGDVLAGVIGGLLAQGLPSARAAGVGACLHGAAADALAEQGERGLRASELLPMLRRYANPQL